MRKVTWRSMYPIDVAETCSRGDGDSIGLPPVAAQDLDRVLDHALHHPISEWEDAATRAVATVGQSPECGLLRSEMTEQQVAEHTWACGGELLIDCEGYHMPLLRVIRNNMRIAGML